MPFRQVPARVFTVRRSASGHPPAAQKTTEVSRMPFRFWDSSKRVSRDGGFSHDRWMCLTGGASKTWGSSFDPLAGGMLA